MYFPYRHNAIQFHELMSSKLKEMFKELDIY